MYGSSPRWPAHAALLVTLVAAWPVAAQYKVVGPDGKVTYTDRQPSPREGKVSALGARPEAPLAETALPAELRQVVSRYPVTLYTTSGACEPCDTARTLLRQRGVPYSEKLVVTGEDGEALQRLSGGRDAPTLTIGSQVLRGLTPDVWSGYLDGAGYPRDSRLPPGYQQPPATPLTERREIAPQRAAAPAPAPVPPAPPPAAEPAIRF
jgi:glutaredoxin